MRKALLPAIALSLVAAFSTPVFAAEPAAPGAAVAVAASVNINTADAATLSNGLDGVGAARARAIIEHREAHGPFSSADDLLEVNGIGPATLEKNRTRIAVN